MRTLTIGMKVTKTFDETYFEICKDILNTGTVSKNRTGVDTISKFGVTYRHNLQDGFPILSTKRVAFKAALHETLWMFIQGSSDCTYLKENNVTIWDSWVTAYSEEFPNGTIGNMYGTVMRSYRINRDEPNNTLDQLQNCIDLIKLNPNSRRIVMTAFDPRFVAKDELSFEENVKEGRGVLNACHSNYIQFNVRENKYLDIYTVQRSADMYLGKPFNIIQVALLLSMVAQITNLIASEIIYSIADAHIYENHLEAFKIQFEQPINKTPVTLVIDPTVQNINDFKFEHFTLENYCPGPIIKAPVAV